MNDSLPEEEAAAEQNRDSVFNNQNYPLSKNIARLKNLEGKVAKQLQKNDIPHNVTVAKRQSHAVLDKKINLK